MAVSGFLGVSSILVAFRPPMGSGSFLPMVKACCKSLGLDPKPNSMYSFTTEPYFPRAYS